MADQPRPLQNRVTPEGEIIACAARGTMMGNRGGALHTPKRTLAARRWRTKAWICCLLQFKGRHRTVMSPNRYTELFFLDEATALAAGHRPCFECRRRDALVFAEAWRTAQRLARAPAAPEMDAVLHPERVDRAGRKVTYRHRAGALPDGAFVRWVGQPHLVLAGRFLAWTPDGYRDSRALAPDQLVDVLTPRCVVAVLSSGYAVRVHATAGRALGQPEGEA
jgi:hypothetical protein